MVVQFEKGEIRRLEWSVCAEESTIVITGTNWKLINKDNLTMVDEGACEIDGRKLTAIVSFPQTGRYDVEITATIPPEIVIERLSVTVV